MVFQLVLLDELVNASSLNCANLYTLAGAITVFAAVCSRFAELADTFPPAVIVGRVTAVP